MLVVAQPQFGAVGNALGLLAIIRGHSSPAGLPHPYEGGASEGLSPDHAHPNLGLVSIGAEVGFMRVNLAEV